MAAVVHHTFHAAAETDAGGDAICFLFITPLASLSGWLCVQGAMDLYYSNGMEAVGLIFSHSYSSLFTSSGLL